MSTKHTPGPWRVERTPDATPGTLSVVTDNGRAGYALVVDVTDARNENVANARLIAAAPELLAALKAARSVIQKAGLECKLSNPEQSIDEVINAAIAHAESR